MQLEPHPSQSSSLREKKGEVNEEAGEAAAGQYSRKTRGRRDFYGSLIDGGLHARYSLGRYRIWLPTPTRFPARSGRTSVRAGRLPQTPNGTRNR